MTSTKYSASLSLLLICFVSLCDAWMLPPARPKLHSSRHRHRLRAVPGADIEQPPVDAPETDSTSALADAASDIPATRGKVNEIDFCIAPADVSLSRAYGATPTSSTPQAPVLSLTKALNNASNRAIRRILLARSWPSAEALNMSLRQVAEAERKAAQSADSSSSTAKCPVPRPILNVLTRKRDGQRQPIPRGRTDEEYVADQLKSFQERYGTLPGYNYAEAYLESILSLATSGIESLRVTEVLESGVYDEAYKRVVSVLKSVGVVFEKDPKTGLSAIAKKLVDQDICFSMMDKIHIKQEKKVQETNMLTDVKSQKSEDEEKNDAEKQKSVISKTVDEKNRNRKLKFWQTGESKDEKSVDAKDESRENLDELTQEDLGGVLLSAEEPTLTRQLNVLSNIVQRALLFGGDQELLVLAETLFADRPAFVQRWYPGTGDVNEDLSVVEDRRPGLQYLNCLIQLLRDCYSNGVVMTLDSPLPLSQGYANAYERLVASAVELGSGYIKPVSSDVMDMPKPRTAQEELGRFAVWETNFRKSRPDVSAYPEDLVGTWEVRDEIGGETIGISKVILGEQGKVEVAPPLEGLRWRLDGGPAHLDTCSFQVLSSDGTILQYRGFIDRGARLEARFSKRALTIRGSVMFQMRDGSVDFYRDMLPINYRQGTTKFVMTRLWE